MRLDQRYPGRFDPPPPSRGPPDQPPTGWRQALFLALGLIAAVLLTLALVNSVAGLATAPKPSPEAGFDIPEYARSSTATLMSVTKFCASRTARRLSTRAPHCPACIVTIGACIGCFAKSAG